MCLRQKPTDEGTLRLLRSTRAAMQEELRPLLLQQAHVEEDNKESGPVRHARATMGRSVTCTEDRCWVGKGGVAAGDAGRVDGQDYAGGYCL